MGNKFVGHLAIGGTGFHTRSFAIYENSRSVVQPLEEIITSDFDGAEIHAAQNDDEIHIFIKRTK